ncbi:hypothetical protein [Patulibacter americanus]|uniref:hypothetical protein n=1 Tax=Patulibacter americanus TaxID=588672 RepID=UPI0003B4C938|nr:hypothetical protein [Patulibacter americanus]
MSSAPAWQRLAWPALLTVVVVFVLSDFLRHPFRPFQPSADAASRPSGLRLSVTGTEAADPVGAMTQALAAALNAPAGRATGSAATGGDTPGGGRAEGSHEADREDEDEDRADATRTVAERLPGATTTAVESVLGVGEGSRRRLLVLTPQTLVQLQQDRGETIVPGVALRAERAWHQLEDARAVALVAADPLTLEVAPGSPLRTVAQLARVMRAAPERRVFGVGLDSWSRAALARLVQDARVEGTVSYRTFVSARDASRAVAGRDADVVVGTRGSAEGVDPVDRLRRLSGAWPGGQAPTRWIALVAPGSTPAHELRRLRARLRRVVTGPSWARTLRTQGLVRPRPGMGLDAFLARERVRSGTLSATLADVDLSVRP